MVHGISRFGRLREVVSRPLRYEQTMEISEHCMYALEAILEGMDVNSLKEMLKLYGYEENWLACEGIRKAIEFSEKATINEVEQFKTEIEWLHWNKLKSG